MSPILQNAGNHRHTGRRRWQRGLRGKNKSKICVLRITRQSGNDRQFLLQPSPSEKPQNLFDIARHVLEEPFTLHTHSFDELTRKTSHEYKPHCLAIQINSIEMTLWSKKLAEAAKQTESSHFSSDRFCKLKWQPSMRKRFMASINLISEPPELALLKASFNSLRSANIAT